MYRKVVDMKNLLTFFMPEFLLFTNENGMNSYIQSIVGDCPNELSPAKTTTHVTLKTMHEVISMDLFKFKSKCLLNKLQEHGWIVDKKETKLFLEKPVNQDRLGVYVTVYSLNV